MASTLLHVQRQRFLLPRKAVVHAQVLARFLDVQIEPLSVSVFVSRHSPCRLDVFNECVSEPHGFDPLCWYLVRRLIEVPTQIPAFVCDVMESGAIA